MKQLVQKTEVQQSSPTFILISIFLSLGFILISQNSFAMGKSPANAEIDQLKQTITANQQTINAIRLQLRLPNEPTPAIPTDATVADLWTIEQTQQQEIQSLSSTNHTNDEANQAIEIQATKDAAALFTNNNIGPTKWVESRCSALADTMESQQGLVDGRKGWSENCMGKKLLSITDQRQKQFIAAGTYDPMLEEQYYVLMSSIEIVKSAGLYTQGRWFYPSFGTFDANGNPQNALHLVAPTVANDDCGVSYQTTTPDGSGARNQVSTDLFNQANYKLVAMCVTGCYTPDQQLSFGQHDQTIENAMQDHVTEATVLSEDSSLDNPSFVSKEILAYTADIAPSLQEILDIQTLSGKKLSVTRNHALLTAKGEMSTADSFKVGDALVLADGTRDPIVEISGRSYYGKVFNVRMKSTNLLNNVLIAQGILSGSVFYQNEGVKDLNRSLFRVNLPSNIFN